MADHERGSVALLVLMGGGVVLLMALVLLVTVGDLVVSRGQAQLAADAAALAAMGEMLAQSPAVAETRVVTGAQAAAGAEAGAGAAAGGRTAADELARANGGLLLDCCGDRDLRREVEVGVTPGSALLRLVVPVVRARAAAALEPSGPLADGSALGGALAVAGGSTTAVGDRMWPVAGTVTSRFGMRRHPVRGGVRMHTGLDVAAATGTPIRAAAGGQVVRAGTLGGYGQVVDIAHGGGTITRYAHQSRLLVASGQQVAAGQVIGLVGSTGTATGPHLHVEVRTATGPIDPLSWLPP